MAGGAQAKMSTWFSKPNQSLISKVTKKRVGFNLKIFVFALLKTVHCRAERNPGRIGRLFNCNDGCFFIWREAPKPKCLPGLVSPIKVWFQRWPKKRVGFNLKIFVFALLKTVQNRARNPGRIGRLFNCKQVFFHMAGGAQAKMSTWFSKPNQSLISKVTKKRVGFNLKIFVFALLKTVHCRAERNPGRIGRLFNCNDRCFFIWREAPKPSTWFSKPNQSLISKVTKKRVGFNLKIFVFALLKTVNCRAERNPGRIGRLFNCNDRCFFIWQGGAQAKMSTWFSKPNQSLISKVTKKRVGFNLKIFVFALLKTVHWQGWAESWTYWATI